MMSFSKTLLVLGLVSFFLSYLEYAAGECTGTGWDWAFNALGQTPCMVLEILEQTCPETGNTPFVMSPCRCNTVFYSLVQGCNACKNEDVQSWSSYNQLCISPAMAQYPESVPYNTQIPSWAFQDINGDMFNLTSACQAATNIPTTLGSSTTLTLNPSQTPGSSTPAPPVQSVTQPSVGNSGTVPASNSPHSNFGPIVGVVVGTIMLLVLISIWVVRYTNRQRAYAEYIRRSSSHSTLFPQTPEAVLEPYDTFITAPSPPPSPSRSAVNTSRRARLLARLSSLRLQPTSEKFSADTTHAMLTFRVPSHDFSSASNLIPNSGPPNSNRNSSLNPNHSRDSRRPSYLPPFPQPHPSYPPPSYCSLSTPGIRHTPPLSRP